MARFPPHRLKLLLARAWCATLDLLFPRRCASCGRTIREPDGSQVCPTCLANLPRIDRESSCQRCGLPLGPYALDHEGRYCEGCRNLPFAGFRRAAAVGTYEGPLRRAICRSRAVRGSRSTVSFWAACPSAAIGSSTGVVGLCTGAATTCGAVPPGPVEPTNSV